MQGWGGKGCQTPENVRPALRDVNQKQGPQSPEVRRKAGRGKG